ncbi:hypothetical protein VL15_26855 [Burkholderia cepacia]|uniref:Uncharacterized protein n=2 Tax=Burkholderia cepacia TaxID=292 RepID=A0A0J5ZHZ7_BURCE|nr:hypothetical protein VL15_26855 [Burkholderia cepacia]
MTPSPLVPVEGALARPRAAPLDRVPPFGREWTFRGAPGARPDKHCLATLTTSCIDVDRPHRACRWQPLPVATAAPTSARSPVAHETAAAGLHSRRNANGARDRRAMYATCWSIGALGIIGWLIAAYESPAGFGPANAIHTATVAPDHATSSTGTVRVAAVHPGTSTNATPSRTVATPVAKIAEASSATHGAARRPPSHHPKATSDVQRTAAASPHRTNGERTTTAPARTATVSHLAARPPIQRDAANTRTRDRLPPPPRTTDTLDDPLTLIAMASALGAIQPARAAHAPAAGFDWTSQLSHRRVTDTPDAFAR